MSDGMQSDYWRSFYENAWARRLSFVNDLIEVDGEYSPIRCVNLIAAKERKFHLCDIKELGRAEYIPRDFGAHPLLPTGLPVRQCVSVNGEQILMPTYTNSNLSQVIVDFVSERGPFDAIIELGCGWGAQLIEAYYGGLPVDSRLFGGELTQSGCALAQRVASLDPRINARFFPFDHLKADLSIIRAEGFERVFVFTSHSLEQVREVPLSFFAEIAGCAPSVTVLHLEPFGFQIDSTSPASAAQRAMFEAVGWNLNLVAVSEQAEKASLIRREWISVNNFLSTDTLNQTSIMVWSRAAAP